MNLNLGNSTTNMSGTGTYGSNSANNVTNGTPASSNTANIITTDSAGNVVINPNILLSDSNAKNAVEVLKNMLAGDTFSGQITSINGNEIVLKLNNGMNLNATLLSNSNISVGQSMTFLINEISNTKILIRPLETPDQQTILIGRALEASNLPLNFNNVQLVKSLLLQNMPIDSTTLTKLSKELIKFPDIDINTLVRMTKLNIPITEGNIKQYEAYKSFDHSISNDLNELSKSFGDYLSNNLAKEGTSDTASLIQKFMNVLGQNLSDSQKLTSKNEMIHNEILDNKALNNDTLNNDKLNNELLNNELLNNKSGNNGEPLGKFLNIESRTALSKMLIDTFGNQNISDLVQTLKDGTLTAKEFLQNIYQLIKDVPDNTTGKATLLPELHGLFQSKEFSDIIKLIARESLRLSPQDFKDNEDLTDYYKKFHQTISNLADQIAQNKDTSFSKSLDIIKNNVEFMSDLNKNMAYFQVPIKFSERDGESELYVFSNKKSLRGKNDQLSALLHLNMDNLGALDVWVKLSGKNVSTNFCLENEELLNFVNDHIDLLQNRLSELGYNMSFEMKIKEETAPDLEFEKDFLDFNNHKTNSSQFIFDTKA